MHVQFVLTAIAFGIGLVMAGLTATGILPGPAAVIDAWSATRPTIPRRWLAAGFWGNLLLPVAACGIYAGTAGDMLSTPWNDLAQLFFWLSMAVDAAIARRRIWLGVTALFLLFSLYEVATHLIRT